LWPGPEGREVGIPTAENLKRTIDT
jgi:hypothetical protein